MVEMGAKEWQTIKEWFIDKTLKAAALKNWHNEKNINKEVNFIPRLFFTTVFTKMPLQIV